MHTRVLVERVLSEGGMVFQLGDSAVGHGLPWWVNHEPMAADDPIGTLHPRMLEGFRFQVPREATTGVSNPSSLRLSAESERLPPVPAEVPVVNQVDVPQVGDRAEGVVPREGTTRWD